jgi:hypothetical protein
VIVKKRKALNRTFRATLNFNLFQNVRLLARRLCGGLVRRFFGGPDLIHLMYVSMGWTLL